MRNSAHPLSSDPGIDESPKLQDNQTGWELKNNPACSEPNLTKHRKTFLCNLSVWENNSLKVHKNPPIAQCFF